MKTFDNVCGFRRAWVLSGVALVLAVLPLAALPPAAKAQGGFGMGMGHPGGGRVSWSGTVDDTTIVTIHRGDVNTRVVKGKDSGDVNSQVSGRLPDHPVRVFLVQRSGRGRIQIVQQPNPGNDFAARVRIHDPQSGSGFYRFVLVWHRPGGPGAF